MSTIVNCPSCSRNVVPEDLLGRLVKCPSCGNKFSASAGEAGEAPTSPPVQEQEKLWEEVPEEEAAGEEKFEAEPRAPEFAGVRPPRRR